MQGIIGQHENIVPIGWPALGWNTWFDQEAMGVQVGWVKEQLRAQKCGILELVRHRQVIYERDLDLPPAVECRANAAIFSDAGACRAVHGVSWWILANAVNPTLRS